MDFVQLLAKEFSLRPAQVQAVIELLDGGNTIPFIARYRKEATGSLDDQVLRELSERLEYLKNLQKRRLEIEKSLTEQDVLTEEMQQKLLLAVTLSELEDLYLPYRPKRRTRATIAKEKGLEPLAMLLFLQQPFQGTVEDLAKPFISEEKGVLDAETALAHARDIIAEMVSEDAALRKNVRATMLRESAVTVQGNKEVEHVYALYNEFTQPLPKMAPHQILAVNRGEREGFLKVSMQSPHEKIQTQIVNAYVKPNAKTGAQVEMACNDAWERLLCPSMEREMRNELTDRANVSAISVFSKNLHQLLLQPPIKGNVTLGVDPGFRTGCKLAVIDESGKVLETGVGHFTLPGQTFQHEQAKKLIKRMVKEHSVTAIAIGNGTASRESEQFIAKLLPEFDKKVAYTIVSEAGASVYSASKLAAQEFPEFDVSLRSAVSIARRMQDPLAELVKIDPKAIGVGQYQHDLKQNELTGALNGVVEQCVNMVGVEVSTASAELLSHVAGIGPALAKNIVAYRDENGIASRARLKKVPKLGPRAFEQCAGFLRVSGSKNALDGTGVHPESYDAAKKLLTALQVDAKELKKGGIWDIVERANAVGIAELSKTLDIGVPTLNDILQELKKPGRDPRDELPKPVLRTDVLDMKDLAPGMELTGTVRNVIDFGAFVDIGVHQDGLVHISRLADRFVRNPSEVVKVGDVVKVWVVDVDMKKKRIALSMVKGRE